ncbi:MAG: hypothetical protein ACF8XB_09480, partial [Planctomycetota bacterium JB042]
MLRLLAVLLLTLAGSAGSLLAQDDGAAPAEAEQTFQEKLDDGAGWLLEKFAFVPFYNLAKLTGDDAPHVDAAGEEVIGPTGAAVNTDLPLVVLWLVFAAVFFTLRYRFANVRLFGHAIQV